MLIYPFSGPIILTDAIYSEYGGKGTGSFTQAQLRSSYWLAETQVTRYIGAPLLPVIVTGTYGYENRYRLATDYGYVSRLIAVNVNTPQNYMNCDLQSREGCGRIWNDTFGYVDFKQIESACGGCWSAWPDGIYLYDRPYQVQVIYEAGLPTGTANQPGILEALTIMAQIDLNEKSPGLVGSNEGVGDVGIQRFSAIDYSEGRRESDMKLTALGSSPKAMRAARLIDATIKKARRSIRL